MRWKEKGHGEHTGAAKSWVNPSNHEHAGRSHEHRAVRVPPGAEWKTATRTGTSRRRRCTRRPRRRGAPASRRGPRTPAEAARAALLAIASGTRAAASGFVRQRDEQAQPGEERQYSARSLRCSRADPCGAGAAARARSSPRRAARLRAAPPLHGSALADEPLRPGEPDRDAPPHTGPRTFSRSGPESIAIPQQRGRRAPSRHRRRSASCRGAEQRGCAAGAERRSQYAFGRSRATYAGFADTIATMAPPKKRVAAISAHLASCPRCRAEGSARVREFRSSSQPRTPLRSRARTVALTSRGRGRRSRGDRASAGPRIRIARARNRSAVPGDTSRRAPDVRRRIPDGARMDPRQRRRRSRTRRRRGLAARCRAEELAHGETHLARKLVARAARELQVRLAARDLWVCRPSARKSRSSPKRRTLLHVRAELRQDLAHARVEEVRVSGCVG